MPDSANADSARTKGRTQAYATRETAPLVPGRASSSNTATSG